MQFIVAKGKGSVSRCLLMWERIRIGSEESTDIGEHAAQPRFSGQGKFMRRPLQQWLISACGRSQPFDHIRPTLRFDTSIHYGIFELRLVCASSQDVMEWKSAGPGADEVKRGQGPGGGQTVTTVLYPSLSPG